MALALARLQECLPALGVRAVGTLATLAPEAARALALEQKKLELITSRAHSVSEERLQEMLVGYLTTRPAPLFQSKLGAKLPAPFEAALAQWSRLRAMDVPHQSALLEAARAQPAFCDIPQAVEMLQETCALLGAPERVMRGVLMDPRAHAEAKVLAALCAGYCIASHLCEAVLSQVLLAPSQDIELFAVIAAHLDPVMTRQVLALSLADISWGNPEEPENQWTPARARATITARTLLPLVGSPLGSFDLESFEAVADDEVKMLPRRVKELHARWGALLGARARARS